MTGNDEAKQKVTALIDAASGRVHDATTWHWSDDYDVPSLLDELVQNIVDVFQRPAPEGTVQVRIPVVVRSDGEWVAVRHSTMPEGRVEDYAMGCIGHPDHRSRVTYVVAHVPLPAAPVEVKGEVESA